MVISLGCKVALFSGRQVKMNQARQDKVEAEARTMMRRVL
jgi:hypothetical protein